MATGHYSAWWGRDPIRVLSTEGLIFVAGLDRADASTVGRHWNAVRRYLETGDAYDLRQFNGATVTGIADGESSPERHELETDLDAIDQHAMHGEVSFESIYDEVQ